MTIFPPSRNSLFETVRGVNSIPLEIDFGKSDDVQVMVCDGFPKSAVFNVKGIFW